MIMIPMPMPTAMAMTAMIRPITAADSPASDSAAAGTTIIIIPVTGCGCTTIIATAIRSAAAIWVIGAGGAPGGSIAATGAVRSEEHTSELQSLMRISYAVFCLKKKKKRQTIRDKE